MRAKSSKQRCPALCIINASQSQDWCHCCNGVIGVKCIFAIKYNFNHSKSFVLGVSKVTYQYTGIISIQYRYVFLKHFVYKNKNDCQNRTKHNNLLDAFRFNLNHHQ